MTAAVDVAAQAVVHRQRDDAIIIRLRVTPKAGRTSIDGLHALVDGTSALRVRVTRPPEHGKANKAVIALLAKRLGFAKSALEIVAGETARDKQVKITGRPAAIIEALDALGLPDPTGDS